MSIEIRPVRPDELDAAGLIVAYAFMADRSVEGQERMRHILEMGGESLVLLEDGELAACLRVLDFRMLVNGAPVPLGGISSVASLPEHRRKGFAGRLLREALSRMRARGQALSALYTPHPNLYRRYGWSDACLNARYSWNPKHVRPFRAGTPAGRPVRLDESAWERLNGVYRRFIAGRTGYTERDERWWKEAVFRRLYDPTRQPNDVALWLGEGGEPAGYLVYRAGRSHEPAGPDRATFVIQEFVGLNGDASLGLLQYAQSHDLSDEIVWYGPVQDPLALIFDNPRHVKREIADDFMFRVVDVEAAVASRPAAIGAPDGAFSLRVEDSAAPWNEATWRIENASGHLRAKRTAEPAEIAMPSDTFAAVYIGSLRPTEAARAGLARIEDDRAGRRADLILASDYLPYTTDFF